MRIVCGVAIILIAALVFGRYLISRFSLWVKLRILCRTNGFRLRPAGAFWWLRRLNTKACDFHIETDRAVYSVKLIGFLSKKNMLVFFDERRFSRKNMSFQFFWTAFTIPFKAQSFPRYDFRYGGDAPKSKEHIPCYVFCPRVLKITKKVGDVSVPGMAWELSSGERLGKITLFRSSRSFLAALRTPKDV